MKTRMSGKKHTPVPPSGDTSSPQSSPDQLMTSPQSTNVDILVSALAALETRVHTIEELKTTPDQISELSAFLQQIETRLAQLETAEKMVPAELALGNARTLRRILKKLTRDQTILADQLHKTSSQADEALRRAEAAGRISVQRPPGTDQLEQTISFNDLKPYIDQKIEDIKKDIDKYAEKETRRIPPKETKNKKENITNQVPGSSPLPTPTPEGMREDILLILARYGNNIKNIARVEHEALMDKQDIEHTLGRITGRAIQDMCALFLRYQQTTSETKEEETNE